jgi:voltage-gated potassium channel
MPMPAAASVSEGNVSGKLNGWRTRLIPLEDLSRSARQFWVAVCLLLSLVIAAAAFYVNVESRRSGTAWTTVDAIYMAVLTITTIGFMEVHPLSQLGRAFTTGFAITGIAVAAFALRSAASLLVGQQLSAEVQRRRRSRTLREMRNHYIVCGYGRMGREAVDQLRRRGLVAAVIEQDPAALDLLRAGDLPFVEGNATQDEHLRAAGIERARGLIAAVGTDEDNLFVVLSARLLNPNLYIVARAGQEATVDKLVRAGANRVASPYVIGGRALAAAAAEPGVTDFLEQVLHRQDLDVEIASIALAPGSPALGKALSTSGITQEGGAMILAIVDARGQFHTNPRPDTTLKAGDQVIAMGSRAQLAALQQAAGS